MRRHVSIALVALLLSVGFLIRMAQPVGAATAPELRCDSWPYTTVFHWDTKYIEDVYGQGARVSEVAFGWTGGIFGYETAGGRLDGDNARADTPLFAYTAEVTAYLSNGYYFTMPDVGCSPP